MKKEMKYYLAFHIVCEMGDAPSVFFVESVETEESKIVDMVKDSWIENFQSCKILELTKAQYDEGWIKANNRPTYYPEN